MPRKQTTRATGVNLSPQRSQDWRDIQVVQQQSAPSMQNSGLSQLAGALQDFSPKFAEIMQSRYQRQMEEGNAAFLGNPHGFTPEDLQEKPKHFIDGYLKAKGRSDAMTKSREMREVYRNTNFDDPELLKEHGSAAGILESIMKKTRGSFLDEADDKFYFAGAAEVVDAQEQKLRDEFSAMQAEKFEAARYEVADQTAQNLAEEMVNNPDYAPEDRYATFHAARKVYVEELGFEKNEANRQLVIKLGTAAARNGDIDMLDFTKQADKSGFTLYNSYYLDEAGNKQPLAPVIDRLQDEAERKYLSDRKAEAKAEEDAIELAHDTAAHNAISAIMSGAQPHDVDVAYLQDLDPQDRRTLLTFANTYQEGAKYVQGDRATMSRLIERAGKGNLSQKELAVLFAESVQTGVGITEGDFKLLDSMIPKKTGGKSKAETLMDSMEVANVLDHLESRFNVSEANMDIDDLNTVRAMKGDAVYAFKRGVLEAASRKPDGYNFHSDEWVTEVEKLATRTNERFPVPKTVFGENNRNRTSPPSATEGEGPVIPDRYMGSTGPDTMSKIVAAEQRGELSPEQVLQYIEAAKLQQ